MAFSCRTTLPVINAALQNGHPLKRQFHSFKLKGKGNHNVSGRRCNLSCRASEAGILGKLGRVLKEKALADYNRVFTGTSKTREGLKIVDELLTYWKLDESDDLLDELEEALLVSDFGPACSMKIVDIIREEVLHSQGKRRSQR
ncbi:hypothetical protein CYMTET_53685 [Cymbomonas tetramitiformis]|uniref:Signal recognition particle SRP54 helical bundle domain-containing protein n=1 Tax=Cymbomonas tetramitiformis TaxID=36881 RepID=A0AAE0BGE4_9CHLO|nr:hypothetical protein CYMTET_53685 [Cymbomonas tetramitiformis]